MNSKIFENIFLYIGLPFTIIFCIVGIKTVIEETIKLFNFPIINLRQKLWIVTKYIGYSIGIGLLLGTFNLFYSFINKFRVSP